MNKRRIHSKPTNPKIIDLRDQGHQTNNIADKDTSTPSHDQASPASIKSAPIAPSAPRRKKHWTKKIISLFFLLLFIAGLYTLLILLYPKLSKPSASSIQQKAQTVIDNRNQLFFPSIGVNSEIREGGIEILDQGVVWHRLPERGNPEKGGNFILTGHSFVWGYTPQEVTKQSVFYHLNEANKDDEIIVHWNGKAYKYRVIEKRTVKPDQIEIEQPSDTPKLTLYTCTTGGASDGRVVIIAEPKE